MKFTFIEIRVGPKDTMHGFVNFADTLFIFKGIADGDGETNYAAYYEPYVAPQGWPKNVEDFQRDMAVKVNKVSLLGLKESGIDVMIIEEHKYMSSSDDNRLYHPY